MPWLVLDHPMVVGISILDIPWPSLAAAHEVPGAPPRFMTTLYLAAGGNPFPIHPWTMPCGVSFATVVCLGDTAVHNPKMRLVALALVGWYLPTHQPFVQILFGQHNQGLRGCVFFSTGCMIGYGGHRTPPWPKIPAS